MDIVKLLSGLVELINKLLVAFKIPVSVKIEKSHKEVDEENNEAKDDENARPKW